jgi:hypothetical protein
MTRFFSVLDNSFHTRGFPWAWRIVVGLDNKGECPECQGPLAQPEGDLQVLLERNKGSKWPDVLGCGAYPLFIVSERVLEAWRNDKVGEFPIGGRVSFSAPLPKKLERTNPPSYFWLDGAKMLGAKLDFDASGFVGVQFCGTCGRRWDNVKATYDRQHSLPWAYVFVDGTWTGSNLFTTDLSPTAFFCTERVVETARKHQLTNFRFVPVEEGDAPGSPGVQYIQSASTSATTDPA